MTVAEGNLSLSRLGFPEVLVVILSVYKKKLHPKYIWKSLKIPCFPPYRIRFPRMYVPFVQDRTPIPETNIIKFVFDDNPYFDPTLICFTDQLREWIFSQQRKFGVVWSRIANFSDLVIRMKFLIGFIQFGMGTDQMQINWENFLIL